MVHQQYITWLTKGHGDMHDLTEQISQIVQTAGIRTGMVNVFNVGSTGALARSNLNQDYSAIYPNS